MGAILGYFAVTVGVLQFIVLLPLFTSCAASEITNHSLVPEFEYSISSAISFFDLRTSELADVSIDVLPATTDVTAQFTNARIVLAEVTNACTLPPCEAVEDNIGMLIITEVAETFTIADGNISINIPDQAGAKSTNALLANSVVIINNAGKSIIYDISINYNGTAVSEIVATSHVTKPNPTLLLDVSFANRQISVQFLNDTFHLKGLNAVSATGMITNGEDLPAGYSATAVDGTLYTFDDPDEDDTGYYLREVLEEGKLCIAERDTAGNVINHNESHFTVTLTLTNIDGSLSAVLNKREQ